MQVCMPSDREEEDEAIVSASRREVILFTGLLHSFIM